MDAGPRRSPAGNFAYISGIAFKISIEGNRVDDVVRLSRTIFSIFLERIENINSSCVVGNAAVGDETAIPFDGNQSSFLPKAWARRRLIVATAINDNIVTVLAK